MPSIAGHASRPSIAGQASGSSEAIIGRVLGGGRSRPLSRTCSCGSNRSSARQPACWACVRPAAHSSPSPPLPPLLPPPPHALCVDGAPVGSRHPGAQSGAGPEFLVGGGLTIADLFICHYRWLLGMPEFWPLVRSLFEGADGRVERFNQYFHQHMAGPVGQYIASRRGSGGDPDRERAAWSQAVVGKEVRLGHADVEYPFTW